MKKIDFYRLLGSRDYIDGHVFDHWAYWREKQGLSYMVEDLEFNWEYHYLSKTVVVKTCFGKDEFSVTDLFNKVNKDDEPQMLWHCNYYDGPLSGIARYKGNVVWFDVDDYGDDRFDGMRTYKLYELTEKEIEWELLVHNRWRNTGYLHTDYCDDFADPDVKPVKRSKGVLDAFCGWFKKEPKRDYLNNRVIGTFGWCEFWKERERVFLSQKVDTSE